MENTYEIAFLKKQMVEMMNDATTGCRREPRIIWSHFRRLCTPF